MKSCKHIYWYDCKTETYICEKCCDVIVDRQPSVTLETCKKCKHYPCDISENVCGKYNDEYRKRNKLNKSMGNMISCHHKRTRLPVGFVDIDGARYRYAPNQHPTVDNIPFNVKGSGGIIFFRSEEKCKCCSHTMIEWHKMWEPQYDEFVATHPNAKITMENI